MNKEAAEFVIYMINAVADKYNKSTSEVYCILEKVDCINNYLIPYYDVLHTMGVEALIDDISEYAQIRGVKV